MHEMTIAVNIARTVAAVLREHGAGTPVAVRVRAGCMTGIIPEALAQAFNIAAELELGCSPQLLIDQMPITATCAECGHAFEATAFPALCPKCGGVGAWTSGGDELELVSVEVDDDEDAHCEGTHP